MKIDTKSLLVGAFLAAAAAFTIGAGPTTITPGRYQVVAVPQTPEGFVMVDTGTGRILRYEKGTALQHTWTDVTKNMRVD